MKFASVLKTASRSALLALALAGAAHAAEFGTPAEAEAMVKKAVALIKTAGPEKAYEEMSNSKAFKDRDLYIFANDFNGKALAHGANPKLIGKDLSGLKDSDGKLTVQMQIEVARTKGKGWTDEIKFLNPVTQKLQTKVIYVERVGDAYVASGVYK
jgi:signal transduction histidine kinase